MTPYLNIGPNRLAEIEGTCWRFGRYRWASLRSVLPLTRIENNEIVPFSCEVTVSVQIGWQKSRVHAGGSDGTSRYQWSSLRSVLPLTRIENIEIVPFSCVSLFMINLDHVS